MTKIPVKYIKSTHTIPVRVVPAGYMSDAEHDRLMEMQTDVELSQEHGDESGEPDEY